MVKSLFTNDWDGTKLGEQSEWRSHPKGYYQPGVLALSRSGRVLYRWRCRPTRRNAGGAMGRPTPEHVWHSVERARADPVDAPDVAHDDDAVLDSSPTSWPLFIGLLLANGWFLRPQVFDHHAGEWDVPMRIRLAAIRLAGFVAAWVAAAWILPGLIVAVAFGAWALKVWPGVRDIHAGFQNIGRDAEPG